MRIATYKLTNVPELLENLRSAEPEKWDAPKRPWHRKRKLSTGRYWKKTAHRPPTVPPRNPRRITHGHRRWNQAGLPSACSTIPPRQGHPPRGRVQGACGKSFQGDPGSLPGTVRGKIRKRRIIRFIRTFISKGHLPRRARRTRRKQLKHILSQKGFLGTLVYNSTFGFQAWIRGDGSHGGNYHIGSKDSRDRVKDIKQQQNVKIGSISATIRLF